MHYYLAAIIRTRSWDKLIVLELFLFSKFFRNKKAGEPLGNSPKVGIDIFLHLICLTFRVSNMDNSCI